MKKLYFITLFLAGLSAMSCDDNRIITDSLDQYRNIYIRQASEYPHNLVVDIVGTEQVIYFNACLGGYASNAREIYVDFEAMPDKAGSFNIRNGTDYELLSAGSYSIEEKRAVIPSGKLNSNSLKVSLSAEGYIEPGISYLLPIGITATDADVPVNDELSVVYFLFTGTYPLGEEPPVRVFDVSQVTLTSLFAYNNYLVTHQSNGLLDLFPYNSSERKFNTASMGVNGGWNIFNKVLPTQTGFVARWADGNLQEYSVNNLGVIAGVGVTGSGFGIYDDIVSSPHHNTLFCLKSTGELYSVQRDGGGMWSVTNEIGTGWDQFGHVIAYGNGLLTVDQNGDLWFHTINGDKTLGESQQVGSGWGSKYRRMFAFGTYLLAEDMSGIVWAYNFDLRGFWDIER